MRISDWSSDVCSSDLCDEDNRRMLRFCDLPLQVEAVDVWQFDIEDEAGRYIRLVRALVVAGGTECDGPHIVRRQQLAECLPNTFIVRSEEHTSELQSLMRISYAVFCLKKKKKKNSDDMKIRSSTTVKQKQDNITQQ